jgi:hypothetical protein
MDYKSISTLFGVCLLVVSSAHAEERPDFSGIWRSARPARPPAVTNANTATQANPPAATTRSRGWPADPPLKPEAKAKIKEYRDLVSEGQHAPGEFCLGAGMPSSMLGSGGYPMEIIQRPEQITVIYEAHTELRRIYTGGQKFNLDDIFPSRNGFSIGRWEGDTLVVETSKLKEQVDTSAAHSEQAKIVERYRLSKDSNGNKILTAEMTMTDPGFYTAPVTVTKTWQAAEPGTFMIYYECNEPDWLDFVDKLREDAAKKKTAPAGQ